MSRPSGPDKIEAEVRAFISPHFNGMEVQLGHAERWNRQCLTFRWTGFSELLPEERFQRLVAVIPESFRETKLKGLIWLELTPDESIEDFLKLPRSEDVIGREGRIYKALKRAHFFKRLQTILGSDPPARCPGGFTMSEALMATSKNLATTLVDVKLMFIRFEAYCDCQALESALPTLEEYFTTGK